VSSGAPRVSRDAGVQADTNESALSEVAGRLTRSQSSPATRSTMELSSHSNSSATRRSSVAPCAGVTGKYLVASTLRCFAWCSAHPTVSRSYTPYARAKQRKPAVERRPRPEVARIEVDVVAERHVLPRSRSELDDRIVREQHRPRDAVLAPRLGREPREIS